MINNAFYDIKPTNILFLQLVEKLKRIHRITSYGTKVYSNMIANKKRKFLSHWACSKTIQGYRHFLFL